MLRRFLPMMAAAALLVALAGCTNKNVKNPIADVNSKQPDKVLFDRAMDAMKHNRYEVARMTLQTLINTYPDSEFLARAKMAVGDSWYNEGGAAAWTQAENEYNDFITFFPNMPEAAEAQMKIGNIEYRQMEKPDRDFTHAMRAEEEYRKMLLQYPDSKLAPEARERLMQVQEVLAEREFLVGRFYYLRESWAAALARLQSLVDTYPLYSGADEALFMIGQAYERQMDAIRKQNVSEVAKGEILKELGDKAAKAYDRILTRYPAMARAEDAKSRLEALHLPVPQASPEMIAQNKKEEDSRGEAGLMDRFMLNFHRRPDTSQAATVGEPTLTDPKQIGAPDVVKESADTLFRAAEMAEKVREGKVSVEQIKNGEVPPSQPIPREGQPPAAPAQAAPAQAAPAQPAQPAAAAPAAQEDTGIEELKPDAGSSETPAAAQPAAQPSNEAAPVAPPQSNELDSGASPKNATAEPDPKNSSSSMKGKKHRKKKDKKDEQPH